jgi:GNAT superfamily N-acetyltransferase
VRIEVRPATLARFDDVATMLGPKNPDSSVCWCLSHRLDSKANRELAGPARGEYVKKLCGRKVAPGVLAYEDVAVVGWAAVAPRSELPFARSTKIPHVDQLPVWSVWCFRVHPGHRGKGIAHALLDGAVAYARSARAAAIEGYPVDWTSALADVHELFAISAAPGVLQGDLSLANRARTRSKGGRPKRATGTRR